MDGGHFSWVAELLHPLPTLAAKGVSVRAFVLLKQFATKPDHGISDDAIALWTRFDLIQRQIGKRTLVSSVEGVVAALAWPRERVVAALHELTIADVVAEFQEESWPADAP